MNDDDNLIPLLTILLVFWGTCYGCYKIGRHLEHQKAYKELYTELAAQTEDIYMEGFRAGMTYETNKGK